MQLLLWWQIILLISPNVGWQHGSESLNGYVVVMYKGIPSESLPPNARKKSPPERALLVANVDQQGLFHAKEEGMMFEGRLLVTNDGKLELKINQSDLNTTSCFPITATVIPGQAASPHGCAFSSIIFSYYFRVKHKPSDNPHLR